mgnify:CR=1 FL=1
MPGKLSIVVYPSETIVIDQKGKKIVSCPTEKEAMEYIREQEGSEDNESQKR